MNFTKIILLFTLLAISQLATAQTLPVNQPEQDACNALVLCGTSFFTPYSYDGNGTVSDLEHTPCDAPATPSSPALACGEENCVWLKLVINTSGTLVFTITPVAQADDYDFAVINATNINCNNIPESSVVRCNFNRNQPISNNGIVGLSTSSNITGVQGNTPGQPYVQAIDAVAGETYLIMVNNFGTGNGPSSGFTINFAGSTATFNNTGNPQLSNLLTPVCNYANQVTVQLNKEVKCSSIATDGSDFYLTPSGTIANATGINCSGANGYTDKVQLTFSQLLAPGNYVLHAQQGTDNNTLLDLCDYPLLLPAELPFTVHKLTDTVTMIKCPEQLPFVWNGITVTQGGSPAAIYHQSTSFGCDSSTALILTVSNIITATDTVIKCSEDMPFVWNGITVTQSGSNAAVYSTTNNVGCDSVTTLNLTVIPPINTVDNKTICTNQLPYTWNGITVNNGGSSIATAHLTSSQGCDSTVTLNLTVTPIKTNTVTLSVCAEDLPTVWNGIIIPAGTQSGDSAFIFYTQTSTGCDSNVYLNLTVHPYDPITVSQDTFACGHFDYKGHSYTHDITLTDTFSNQYGCDSTYITFNITVYDNEPAQLLVNANGCDSSLFEGNTYMQDTVLVDTFKDVHGCDSLVRTVLVKVEDFQLNLATSADTIAQGEYVTLTTSANYDYNVVSWEPQYLFPAQQGKQQTFKPDITHDYLVIAKSDIGCMDTAHLPVVVDTLIPDFLMPNAFTPNGDGHNDLFGPVIYNKSGYIISFFRVYNRWGNMVYDAQATRTAGWNGNFGNSGKPADAGVYNYVISVRFVNGKVVTKKGDVTLMR